MPEWEAYSQKNVNLAENMGELRKTFIADELMRIVNQQS